MKVEILRRDCPSRSPHFNPLRPCGRRPDELWDRLFSTRFQSTPPVWAETFTIRHLTTSFKFQSTPPVWAETSSFASSFCDILLFQSTPPVWAETPGGGKQAPDRRDFNPLRPCGRRLSLRKFFLHRIWISIHSARVGGDFILRLANETLSNFNPLRPCGRRPESALKGSERAYFNPLRPCGRRLLGFKSQQLPAPFQSTPPVWAETFKDPLGVFKVAISIHSARVGGDLTCTLGWLASRYFNPLRPCGRRPIAFQVFLMIFGFQSTPPVWAETAKETIFSSLKHLYYNIFYRKKQENSM